MVQAVLAILLLLVPPPTVDAGFLKCRDQSGNREPLFALDGKLLGRDSTAFAHLSADDVHALYIMCMDPQDSTFNSTSGVPVIVVWTKQGPAALVEPTLEAMVAAQDAYYREHGTYANDPARLGLAPYPSVFRVEMQGHDTGWIAAISMDLFVATCYVFDGDVETLPAGLSLRVPKCMR